MRDPLVQQSGELCHRGGSEWTSLLVDGAKHSVKRPRARKGGEEMLLPSLEKMRDQDLLDQQMLARIVRGVSTRNYEGVINGFAEKTGVKKSSVSRVSDFRDLCQAISWSCATREGLSSG